MTKILNSTLVIDKIAFPFELTDFNLNQYKIIIENVKNGLAFKIESIEEKELIRINQDYYLIDHFSSKIISYFSFKIRIEEQIKVIYNIRSWREAGSSIPKSFTQHIMFDYLIPISDLITSVEMQTNRGFGLWQDFITNAFKKGYFVWSINKNKNEFLRIKTREELNLLPQQILINVDYNSGALLGVSKNNVFKS